MNAVWPITVVAAIFKTEVMNGIVVHLTSTYNLQKDAASRHHASLHFEQLTDTSRWLR
jgi:hypothetical protein